jgi:PAS domain S-box-containing protein
MRLQGSIQQRLRRLSLLTSGIALLAASASFVVYDVRTFRTSSIQRLSSQADIVGANSVSALLFNDETAAHEALQALSSEPAIQTAAIYARGGRLFARYRPGRATRPVPETDDLTPAPRGGSLWAPLVIRRPIYFQDGLVGAVRLDCDLWPQMRGRLVEYLVIVLLVSLGALAVAGLVTGRLQRLLTHPINDLVNTARIVSQSKDYSVRVRSSADGELRVLVETFNQMLADIEQRDAALSDSRVQLEQKVLERTLELQRELYDRQRAEEARAHSQALLARAEALAQIGSWEWDLRHEEMRWSDQLYRLLGVAPATRASHQGLLDGVHPEDRAAVARQLQRTRATGESVTFEHRIVRPDGGIRIVQAQVERLVDAAGHGLRLVGTAQDVTERRQAETEREQLIRAHVAQQVAEASERRAAALSEASAELAASLDVESALPRVVRRVIPEFADWCSVHLVEDGTARRVALACADPEAERDGWCIPYTAESRALLVRVMQEQTTLVSDLTEECLAGWVGDEGLEPVRRIGARSVILLPLRARGLAMGVVTLAMTNSGRRFARGDLAFAENIGSRIATALDNARLYREAQNANRMKDEFLATLSHELRTPLNAIVGWTQLLRVGALDEVEAQRAIETIDRNARVQAQLIEDILDVSRIISGKLQLEMGPVDLAPVVLAAVDAIRPGAEAKQIMIDKDVASSVVVTGDPDRLQQIFWNLLSNATKFTPRGGRLQVKMARANGQAEVAVIDTGAGIEPEFMPHVFERFRQADASSTRAHRGLGLGLAIVRHLTELHGGTVQATSAGRNQGATFTVTLPLAGLDLPTAPSRGNGDVADAIVLDGIKVVVVDDEPDGRDVIEAALGRLGARVFTAASSRDAMDLIPREHPDVVVADIEMPVMDGYALMRWLRSLPPAEGGATPAVALTGYARAEDRRNALAAGFQAHLTKPVRPEDVARTVRRLTGARPVTG